ncbi:hypothetical protein Anapl_14941 [Anas platyrhynchos]|uniref:Uncharacterized protein n=1 Tax=Anas platyrhynchos TaxID=8839 RepID=R0KXM0_ANAPL|nr:hypothetical protein Anapl_14941 [Anas platyrhynchos]
MNFLFVAVLALPFLLGYAEVGEEEEMTRFLYEYASHFGDYLYATIDYYPENSTILPTIYLYEEMSDSAGSSLHCHLPLVVLLSLLGVLL